MTAQEAITKLTNIMHDDHYSWHPSILEAFRMAVDALKGADGDLISRKEAIDRIESHLRTGDELYPLTYTDKVVNHGIEIAASCVYNLPSAQPEIVRCKDCKFTDGERPIADGRYWCVLHSSFMYFCSDAERRDDCVGR